MKNKPTLKACRVGAKDFIKDYVKTGRQWSDRTIDLYMPAGWRLSNAATFADVVTVESVSRFMWREAVEDDQ